MSPENDIITSSNSFSEKPKRTLSITSPLVTSMPNRSELSLSLFES